MCGIAGIIGRLDDRNRAALERMSNAMVHRGPDGSGTWVSERRTLAAGARSSPTAVSLSWTSRQPAPSLWWTR